MALLSVSKNQKIENNSIKNLQRSKKNKKLRHLLTKKLVISLGRLAPTKEKTKN